MKKVLLFIASGITVFCLFPIATTQAMPREAESKSSIASNPTNSIVLVLEPCTVITELGNPALNDNILSYDMQELRGTTIARGGNPHVKRRGYGRSTMGDNYDNESDGEDEDYGDDSAVEYNEELEDSSGYNKDL
jgi:hypothetical protein